MTLKQRLIVVAASLALLFAGIGASGIVADSVGLAATPQTHACVPMTSGGGC